MGVGVSPILTRQLCAAMFALSGHIFFTICLALGLLQIQPERSVPRKNPVVHIKLTSVKTVPAAAKSVAPAPPVTAGLPALSEQQLPSMSTNAVTNIDTYRASSINSPESAATATTTVQPALGKPQHISLPANNLGNTATNPVSSSPQPAQTTRSHAETAAAPVDIPYYHSLKQLTEKPRVVEDAASGMNLILPGVETQNVILRLLINEQGVVDQVEIEHSTLMSNIEAVVTAAFAKLRFTPGKIDGVAVKCQLQIEVSLENADTPVLQRQPLQQ